MGFKTEYALRYESQAWFIHKCSKSEVMPWLHMSTISLMFNQISNSVISYCLCLLSKHKLEKEVCRYSFQSISSITQEHNSAPCCYGEVVTWKQQPQLSSQTLRNPFQDQVSCLRRAVHAHTSSKLKEMDIPRFFLHFLFCLNENEWEEGLNKVSGCKKSTLLIG